MCKNQNNFNEVTCALYLDFDNIYSRLSESNPKAADEFTSHPYRWVKWLENHATKVLYGDYTRRRILRKVCYINPDCYQQFRPAFIKSAFTVVDCPPLTSRGKTSTDIHLVMDCMDDLQHPTNFDEFMILSADSDFTPLLIRLVEHARRTIVLSIGYSSPAYISAASWRIREDWFIDQALSGNEWNANADSSISNSAKIKEEESSKWLNASLRSKNPPYDLNTYKRGRPQV